MLNCTLRYVRLFSTLLLSARSAGTQCLSPLLTIAIALLSDKTASTLSQKMFFFLTIAWLLHVVMSDAVVQTFQQPGRKELMEKSRVLSNDLSMNTWTGIIKRREKRTKSQDERESVLFCLSDFLSWREGERNKTNRRTNWSIWCSWLDLNVSTHGRERRE